MDRTIRFKFVNFYSSRLQSLGIGRGASQQFCNIHTQHLGQTVNDVDARVVYVAFQRADIGAINPSLMRKLLL